MPDFVNKAQDSDAPEKTMNSKEASWVFWFADEKEMKKAIADGVLDVNLPLHNMPHHPLHSAARGGNYSTAKLLLEAGANPNTVISTRGGAATPLDEAYINESEAGETEKSISSLILGYGGKTSAWILREQEGWTLPDFEREAFRLIEAGDAAAFEALLDSGLSQNTRNGATGETLLSRAVRHEQTAIIQTLRLYCANPHVLIGDDPATAETLMDIYKKTRLDSIPWMGASDFKSWLATEKVQTRAEFLADPMTNECIEGTYLSTLLSFRHCCLQEALIRRKEIPNHLNARDHTGKTVLHHVLSRARIHPVQAHRALSLLIREGADPYQTDRNGKNAFDYAKNDQNKFGGAIVKSSLDVLNAALRNRAIDQKFRTFKTLDELREPSGEKNGDTYLHLAVRTGYLPFVCQRILDNTMGTLTHDDLMGKNADGHTIFYHVNRVTDQRAAAALLDHKLWADDPGMIPLIAKQLSLPSQDGIDVAFQFNEASTRYNSKVLAELKTSPQKFRFKP